MHIFHVYQYIKNENNNFIKGLCKVQFKPQIIPQKSKKNPFISNKCTLHNTVYWVGFFGGWFYFDAQITREVS